MTYGGKQSLGRYFFKFNNTAQFFRASPKDNTMAQQNKKNLMKKARGQGMTEYIIIVALIAIAAIGVITLFGDNIRALFGMSADALAGDTNVANRASYSKTAKEKKQIKNFGEQNTGY
jgi:pilus assembly protein Flp/PilA